MSLQNLIINHFSDNLQTQQDTLSNLGEIIEFASQRLVAALLNDRKVLCCGNGRSAAIAQQFSSLMLNHFERERPPLPAIALNTDTSTITSIAGDYHFDDVYAKQLRALGQSDDILLVYCADGNCANILKAITTAHDKEIAVIALIGHEGGMISPLLNETDIEIRVPSNSDARIHELHLLITHCLCDLIDHQLFGG